MSGRHPTEDVKTGKTSWQTSMNTVKPPYWKDHPRKKAKSWGLGAGASLSLINEDRTKLTCPFQGKDKKENSNKGF